MQIIEPPFAFLGHPGAESLNAGCGARSTKRRRIAGACQGFVGPMVNARSLMKEARGNP